jgi:hypothetical protein
LSAVSQLTTTDDSILWQAQEDKNGNG